MLDLLKFSHNRNKDFKTSCDELFEHINKFVAHKKMDIWYRYFENNYSLPRNIIKHY